MHKMFVEFVFMYIKEPIFRIITLCIFAVGYIELWLQYLPTESNFQSDVLRYIQQHKAIH